MGGNKFRCGPVIEVGDDVDELLREPEEGQCPETLVVIGGVESPLKV